MQLQQDNGYALDPQDAQGNIADASRHAVRKAYATPALVHHGAVRDLTTGGSTPNGSEYIIFRCSDDLGRYNRC